MRMRDIINLVESSIAEAKAYTLLQGPQHQTWWANRSTYRLANGTVIAIEVSKPGKTLEVKAKYGPQIIGFVDFAVTEIEGAYRPDTDDYEDDQVSAVAEHVHVDELYRRKGIATIMYDHVERSGVTIKPSNEQWVDGKKFWAARKKR